MRIGFYISNWGGSPLQVGLERGLKELGHTVSYDIGPYNDLTLIFNQCSHVPGYVYPEPFPTGKIAFVDTAEYGWDKRLPTVGHAYQNAFSQASMTHDTKNQEQQNRLFEYLHGKNFPYFIREYLKFLEFPPEYYPIDYPLYAPSVCPERPSYEEYLKRTQDFYVAWGLSHPWRKNLCDLIREMPNTEVYNIEENGPRLDQQSMFARVKGAKCSINFDGYGSSSFRLTESSVRTVVLRGPLAMKQHAPFVDGLSCLDFTITSSDKNFLSSNIKEKIQEVVWNPARSFAIYNNGYDHTMTFLTERATALYLLNTIEGHDYSKPTKILL